MITNQIDLAAYHPLREDEEGLTTLQVAERRHSTRRVSMLRHDLEMTADRARAVLGKSTAELMVELDLDAEQAGDLAHLSRRHLERLERAQREIGDCHG
jgi:hypothetical protein